MSVPGGPRSSARTLPPGHDPGEGGRPDGTRRTGRDSDNGVAGRRPPAAQHGRPRLTRRGAVLIMIIVFLVGNLVTAWTQLSWPGGLGYGAGCLLAAAYARREALLLVVIAPPVIFLTTLTAAELISAGGGTLLAVAEGTILALAAVAPWLFCGTTAGLVVAMMRGLPRCVRDLRAEMSGRPAGTGG
jgi:hypothetical protein